MEPTKKSNMTTTRLVFMTGAAVFSLRGLSFMAIEELTMFFYVLFGTVLFLIPASMVSAELGGAFGSTGGGVYTWVKEAFHKSWGFLPSGSNGYRMWYITLSCLGLLLPSLLI